MMRSAFQPAALVFVTAALLGCDAGTTAVGDGGIDAATYVTATRPPPPNHQDAGHHEVEPECGNGKRERGEECDDGNRRVDDGCNAHCKKEPVCEDGTVLRDGRCMPGHGTDQSPAAGCGNGILESGEQCDDGNHKLGDDCNPFCRFETTCGDGVLQHNEQCEPGGTSTCDENCQSIERPAVCGNRVREGSEVCDDGNTRDGDGCDSTCSAHDIVCGDGVVGPGEDCEPPGVSGCTDDCHFELPPECGNGVVEEYWTVLLGDPALISEECDDGNSEAGDGCDADCAIETVCGNHKLEPGEGCEDGNTTDGDGCDHTCQRECGNGVLTDDEDCDDGNGKNGDGCDSRCHLEVCGDHVVNVGEECDDGNTADGDRCSSECKKTALASHHCGNGTLDTDEECDDGNRVNGDGCSALCEKSYCGDALVNRSEQCDDGTNITDYSVDGLGCAHSCLSPGKCGDGVRQYDFERCDDGNLEDGDGCDKTCQKESTCGNGKLEFDEQCDDGNVVAADGCSDTCTVEGSKSCGDSVVDVADGEQCDDGNYLPGDGCSPWCKLEVCGNRIRDPDEECDPGLPLEGVDAGATPAEPDHCSDECLTELYCGDGVVSPGEECDHGVEASGTGCSETCTIAPACGDGFHDQAEHCDDRNVADGDGCNASCSDEPACGDGRKDPGEECDDGNAQNGDSCSSKCRTVTGGTQAHSGLLNSHFDTDISSWTRTDANVALSFNSQDAASSSSSGSVQATFTLNTGSAGYNTAGAGQCLVTSGGQSYSLSAKALIASSQPASTRAGLAVIFFPSTDCSGNTNLPAVNLPSSQEREHWTSLNGDFSVPEGAASMQVRLKVSKTGTDTTAVILFDDVMLSGGSSGGPSTPAAGCGDGVVNGTDQCDDSNTTNGDGCDSTCHNEPVCGDGVTQSTELCDDGNVRNGDRCSVTCHPTPVCGDNRVELGEQCDDGNQNSGDGCSKRCTTEVICGDHSVAPGEECDDGNAHSGDGCSSLCKVEPKCGDHIKQGSEGCDDGNLVSDDGCSQLCGIEKSCPTDPVDPTCVSSCGDGILQDSLGETCEYSPGSGGNYLCRANCQESCQVCQERECPAQAAACLTATGVAEAGPGKDRPRAELCQDLFDCLSRTSTQTGGPCFTASGDLSHCSELGKCPAELAAAAETEDLTLIQQRRFDAEFVVGAAVDLALCSAVGVTDGHCPVACVQVCGNGMREGSEECDEGADSASCRTCTIVACGNGRVDLGEDCDPTDPNSRECGEDCKPLGGCGDHVLNGGFTPIDSDAGTLDASVSDAGDGGFPFEECDDGNLVDGDYCSRTCHWEYCGDGILQQGLPVWGGTGDKPTIGGYNGPREECDGAPVNGVECGEGCQLKLDCDACKAERCGESVVTRSSCDGNANGGTCAQEVEDVLGCYEDTDCVTKDPTGRPEMLSKCLCGSGLEDPQDCLQAGLDDLNGPCKNEMFKAAGSHPSTLKVSLNLADTDYPIGVSTNLLLCSYNLCHDECAPWSFE